MGKYLFIILIFIVGCGTDCDAMRKKASTVGGREAFAGDILYTVLDNEKVQMTGVDLYQVYCRVKTGRVRRDGIVSKDSYAGEYVIVGFYNHELKWDKEGE